MLDIIRLMVVSANFMLSQPDVGAPVPEGAYVGGLVGVMGRKANCPICECNWSVPLITTARAQPPPSVHVS